MSASLSNPAFRVVRAERGGCLLLTDAGAQPATTKLAVTVGDWVLLSPEGQVAEVLTRSTEIRRAAPNGRSEEQVLCANVDVVGVCMPLEWGARMGRVERFLALAWSSGATPVVIATKADLCPPAEAGEAVRQIEAFAPGAEVLAVSVGDPESYEPVRALAAPDRTLVLVGASGVGKSSLINALIGEERLAAQAIREDGKGRHTTTWRELVELPGGGFLIDTPGLRGVGMLDNADGVAAAFADITELAEQCRFNDCRHRGEPGCMVTAALESGDLDEGRLERHRKLEKELAYQARRFDARAKAEHSRQWKVIAKSNRQPRA